MTQAAPRMLLLDTCVWLDNYLGFRPGTDAARKLIDAALERDIALVHAITSIKDVHYIVAQTLKRERRATGATVNEESLIADEQVAWACIENMREIATAVGMDTGDVWLAQTYRRLHRDIEDNLVIAAAQRARADILVTNNLDLIRHAPIAAMAPADVLRLLEV